MIEWLVPESKLGQKEEMDTKVVRRTVGGIINQMNKTVVAQIEEKNESKNQLIRSSYWYNPIPYVQNQWNAYTSSDYYAYKTYREQVQKVIDMKMELLVFETWNQQTVDKQLFEQYLQDLN